MADALNNLTDTVGKTVGGVSPPQSKIDLATAKPVQVGDTAGKTVGGVGKGLGGMSLLRSVSVANCPRCRRYCWEGDRWRWPGTFRRVFGCVTIQKRESRCRANLGTPQEKPTRRKAQKTRPVLVARHRPDRTRWVCNKPYTATSP